MAAPTCPVHKDLVTHRSIRVSCDGIVLKQHATPALLTASHALTSPVQANASFGATEVQASGVRKAEHHRPPGLLSIKLVG
jgi:hypothetical protein